MKGVRLFALAWSAVALAGLSAPAPVVADDITVTLWTHVDPGGGPFRVGNIVRAADLLNKQLADAGIDTRVAVEVHENPAVIYDEDAVDLFQAFAAGQGPDLYVTAHEWIGAFAAEGYAANLEEHIARYPEYYSDLIPVLWESTKYKGARYAVPQDSEVRMFFYNKDMLRQIGKDEAFIESLPARVDSGEFTIYDLVDLAKEVVDGGAAKYGLVHRPQFGPDFEMLMASFGIDLYDDEAGTLQISESKLADFFAWLKYAVDQGALPGDLTDWSWDEVHQAFRGEDSFMKFHGIWNVPPQQEAMNLPDAETYFHKIGWLNSPPAEKGGRSANLSHPIVYAVNPDSEHKDLAALLVAIAIQSYFNTEHAVTTAHTSIHYSQAAMPAYQQAWYLAAATPMLARATFLPNHPDIALFNAIIFKGIQSVETGRLDPKEAAAFVIDELDADLGGTVAILD